MDTSTAPPQVHIEHVVAEFVDHTACDEILVMWPDGNVDLFIDPAAAARKIHARANKRVKRDGGMLATMIDWLNTPPGFEPPTVGA